MLRNDSTRFLWTHEKGMFSGNRLWADPIEAVKVGETVGEELFARFDTTKPDMGDSPQVHKSAHEVLEAALSTVDYAALPTERRANILRGIINTLEKCGALGGEPEWATPIGATSTTADIA